MTRIPVPAAALLASACSLFSSENQGPPPLLTELPRSLTTAESQLVAAGNNFGFELLRRVRSLAPDSNLFLSPISGSMALGMTLNGAAGLTLDSMRLALQLGASPLDDINGSSRSLIDLLRGLDRTSEFRIANSIWAKAGVPWKPAFLEAGRSFFDAEVRSLDFQAPATVGTINDWVKEKTNGKIPTILDQIRNDEVMFLINAIYFKGKWRRAFDPKRTASAPFYAADGSVQNVPTMRLEPETHGFASAPDYELLELLYGNGAFAMTIVLPRPGRTLADVTAGLDAARWAGWVASLQDIKIGVALPRFRLEYQRELKDDLSALGMRRAFDGDRAEFGNMADLAQLQGNLFLTRVIQKTFVDVNEEGTEAAAATSVGVGVTAAPVTVEVNRPFLFVLRERLSGTILFVGQVTRVP